LARQHFEHELQDLRQAVLRMATQVESQIGSALDALQSLNEQTAKEVQHTDRAVNEACREIRESCLQVIATQQPVARDLREIMGVNHIALELERMGDYAVRLARRTCTLAGLPRNHLPAEFALMGKLVIDQVDDILDSLINQSSTQAMEVAGRDDQIDQLYHRIYEQLINELAGQTDADLVRRAVTLLQSAHDLERISDRVTNVAEDIVFLITGRMLELG
jgi:phosphate transport system protein